MPETNPAKNGKNLLHSDTLSRMLGTDAMQILRCGICMDFFEVPIVLPCGHTFCLQCLTQMCNHASLSQSPGAGQDVRIGCPTCRVLIYATPILRRNVTCNFIIQSLIESLRVREDRCPPVYSQGVNTEGAGDSKNTIPSSSSLLSSSSSSYSSPSSTPAVDDNNQADVMRMLNDLDRVTMSLARSNVVDRAFIEIEDIRKEHLARERQRQAERDAKTRDQVRAVQNIMKQSREEEQQQQQQRKHQHQHHHFQQLQHQQQRQHQQRQILPRPQDTQQQQLQLPQQVCVNSNQTQQLNLFLGKPALLAPLNSDNCLSQTKTQQQFFYSQPTPQQQQQQTQIQAHRYSQHLYQIRNRENHFNIQMQKELQQQKITTLTPTPQTSQQQQHQLLQQQHQQQHQSPQKQNQSPQQQQRNIMINSIPKSKQLTPTLTNATNQSGNFTPHQEATLTTIDKQPTSTTQLEAPSKNDLTKGLPPTIEDMQSIVAARRQTNVPDVKSDTSGFQSVQLDNDPAVMSFSLVARPAATTKEFSGKTP